MQHVILPWRAHLHIIVVHALIDVAMVVIAVTSNRDITMAEDLFATGMIGGQMLLLASWLGFSESRTRNKVSAFTVGCMFLSTVAIICTGATQGGFNQSSPQIVLIVAIPVVFLTALFCLAKRFVFRPMRAETMQRPITSS